MKTSLIGWLICFVAIAKVAAQIPSSQLTPSGATANRIPSDTPYAIVERDADSRVWQGTNYEKSASGQLISHVRRYKELATGMHYRNVQTGEWLESSDQIEVVPTGGAEAVHGQHQVRFPADLYDGIVEIFTPDGKHLKSRPVGISYFDGKNSVLIAELKHSVGQILPSGNQVIYTNAFTDFAADLILTYRRDGFESDLVFREQPPEPQVFGLDPQKSRLELLTEFFDSPEPEQLPLAARHRGATPTNKGQSAPESPDVELRFGKMTMIHGQAFSVTPEATVPTRPAQKPGQRNVNMDGKRVSVRKVWTQLNGRKFLFEDVQFSEISPKLKVLPTSHAATSRQAQVDPILHRVSSLRLLPSQRLAQVSTNKIQLAQINSSLKLGVVLDYNIINSDQGDFTFRGDTTYYVSGTFYINGLTTLEGGTVIKFPEDGNETIFAENGMACKTGPYRMAVFTSKNDNTVGDTISGSTGSPATAPTVQIPGFTYPDLYVFGDNDGLKYLRFCYAGCGLGNEFLRLSDSQFINCGIAVEATDSLEMWLHNILFSHCAQVSITDAGNAIILHGEHLTVDQCGVFEPYWDRDPELGTSEAWVTNSIFTASGGIPSTATTDPSVVILSSSDSVYQSVGGANYYLAGDSAYRNAGTANIDPLVLADIQRKTTYPPITTYQNGQISSDVTLSPQVQRDTDVPDIGYHYDALDYLVGNEGISNAKLTINAGTAIGGFAGISGNTAVISVYSGGSISAVGDPNRPIFFASYDLVQESPIADWSGSGFYRPFTTFGDCDWILPGNQSFKFTKWSVSAGKAIYFAETANPGALKFSHSELYNGSIYNDCCDTALTNCLLSRIYLHQNQDEVSIGYPFAMENCLMLGGTVSVFHVWNSGADFVFQNNLFDHTAMDVSEEAGINDHNGYIENCDRLVPEGSGDQILTTSPSYLTGPLGNYYLPASMPLIDAGSTSADQVGLYHFTTQVDQTKEAYSMVDIGYHYLALDAGGNPIDTDGDGIPDYLEDANGDGYYDDGDLGDWTICNYNPGSIAISQPLESLMVTVSGAGVAGANGVYIYHRAADGSDAYQNANGNGYSIVVYSPGIYQYWGIQDSDGNPIYGSTTGPFGGLFNPAWQDWGGGSPAPAVACAVCTGAPIDFTVLECAQNFTYQWIKNGVNTVGTSATYYINPSVASDSGTYSCKVFAPGGSMTMSDSIGLNVLTPPSGVVVSAGDSNGIMVSGAGTAAANGLYTNNPADHNFYSSANYSIKAKSGGAYYDLANSSGTRLYTSSGPVGYSWTTVSGSQPAPASIYCALVCAGSSPTLTVAGSGQFLLYQWQISRDNGVTWSSIQGGTNAFYTLSPIFSNHYTDQYRCIVSNPCGSASSSITFAQSPACATRQDTTGTDFWMAFMTADLLELYPNNQYPYNLSLAISSPFATTATVSIPNITPPFSQVFSVTPGAVTRVDVPLSAMLGSSNVVVAKAVHITSDLPVSVYGFDYAPADSDAFECLPTPLLGTNYCIMSRAASTPEAANCFSEFAIVATENNTTVNIAPSVTASIAGHPGTTPFTVVLQQGESFQLNSINNLGDLTGTFVSSDKPVAIFAGDTAANIPNGNFYSRSLQLEEQFPISAWGKQVVGYPLATREADLYRILAAQDNTVVKVNGASLVTLQKGQFYDVEISGPVEFQASDLIQVALFSNDGSYDGQDNVDGAPFEILLPSTGHYMNYYTISVPDNPAVYIHYINLFVEKSAIGSTIFDGQLLASSSFAPIGSSYYYGIQIPVAVGAHTISSPRPAGVEVYAFGCANGFGYMGGEANFSLVAVPDSFNVPLNTATSCDVLANDVFYTRGDITLTILNQPAHGTATVTADGNVTYTPQTGYSQDDQFTYQIVENSIKSTATVALRNNPPAAADDTVAMCADHSIEIPVLQNDSGSNLRIISIQGANFGATKISFTDTNKITYTPFVPDWSGTDTFIYTVADDSGRTANATVHLTRNDLETHNFYSTPVYETQPGAVYVLQYEYSPLGTPLSLLRIDQQPTHGTAEIGAGNTVTYTRPLESNPSQADWHDQFTYVFTDGNCEVTGTAQIDTINPIVQIGSSSFGANENTATTLHVLTAVQDQSGRTLTVKGFPDVNTLATGNGAVTTDGQTLNYTPNSGFIGDDYFDCTIWDGYWSYVMHVSVSVVNPISTTPMDVTVYDSQTINIYPLAHNVTDSAGTAHISGIYSYGSGSVGFTSDHLTYAAANLYDPDGTSDSFQYTVSDGSWSAHGTVNINIANPIPEGDYTPDPIPENAQNFAINIIDFKGGTDASGRNMTITIIDASGSHGTAQMSSDHKSILYTPDADYVTTDDNPQIACTISDGLWHRDLVIHLDVANQVRASDAYVTAFEGQSQAFSLQGYISDDGTGTLTVQPTLETIFKGDSQTTVSVNGDGTIQYTPAANFLNTSDNPDDFVYTVSYTTAAGTWTDSAHFKVTVVNPVVAANDNAFVISGQSRTIPVLNNDQDQSGGTLIVSARTQGAHGTVSISGDQKSVIYTPNSGYSGVDSFTYTASDGTWSASATVNITVNKIPLPPVVFTPASSATVPPNVTLSLPGYSGAQIQYQVNNGSPATASEPIVVTLTGDSTITAHAVGGANYLDGGTSSQEFGNPLAPVATADYFEVDQDGAQNSFDVLTNDVDMEQKGLAIISVTSPANGGATTDGTQITYTPNASFSGIESFSYTIQSFSGYRSSATITVFVNKSGNIDPSSTIAGLKRIDFLAGKGSYLVTLTGTATATINLNDIMGLCSDLDGDSAFVYSIGRAARGVVANSATGQITYTRTAGKFGSDSFDYVITDGNGGYGTGTVMINQADTDDNGMPDEWQMHYFGHLGNNATDDPDSDGIPNLAEYLLREDPSVSSNPLDLPDLTAVSAVDIPLNISADIDPYPAFHLYTNGVETPLGDVFNVVFELDGKWHLQIDAPVLPNGAYKLQLGYSYTINSSDDLQVVYGSPSTLQINSQITLDPGTAGFENGTPNVMVTINIPVKSYTLDVYDLKGNHLYSAGGLPTSPTRLELGLLPIADIHGNPLNEPVRMAFSFQSQGLNSGNGASGGAGSGGEANPSAFPNDSSGQQNGPVIYFPIKCNCGEDVTKLVYQTMGDIARIFGEADRSKQKDAYYNMFVEFGQGLQCWDMHWLYVYDTDRKADHGGSSLLSVNHLCYQRCDATVTFENTCVRQFDLNYMMFGLGMELSGEDIPSDELFFLWMGLVIRHQDDSDTMARKIVAASYGYTQSGGDLRMLPTVPSAKAFRWLGDCAPSKRPAIVDPTSGKVIKYQHWDWLGIKEFFYKYE